MANPVGMRELETDWTEAAFNKTDIGSKTNPLVMLTSPKGRLSRWSQSVRKALRDSR